MEIPSYIPWKRALHIDFQTDSSKSKLADVSTVPLLLELSSKAVVTSNSLTKAIISSAPKHIIWDLMKAAIVNGSTGQRSEVEMLLPAWPSSVLRLRHLCTDQYNILSTPYFYHNSTADRTRYRKVLQESIMYTGNLVSAFLLIVKEKIDTSLRCLDLQGFPTGDNCVRRLATHAIRLNDTQESQSDEEGCKYTVFLDCALQTNVTLRVVSRALSLSRSTPHQLRLMILNLEMRRLDSSVLHLMDQLWDMPIRGLCNECSTLPHDKLLYFIRDLGSLKTLVVLDLTLCFIEFTTNPVVCVRFGDALQCLPALRRLHLNNNSLGGRVSSILYRCDQPLEYLSLVSCQLALADLEFLAFAPFMSTLLELNVSINRVVSDHVETFLAVLACAVSMLVLNATCCEFEDRHLPLVVPALSQMTQLKYIGFANQALTSTALLRDWLNLSSMKNLECVLLTHPQESYRSDQPDLYDHAVAVLLEEAVESNFAQQRKQTLPNEPAVQFIWSL